MKRYFVYLFFYSFISCHLSVEDKVYNSGIHIIPEPLQLEVRQGVFPVSNSTTLSLENGDWEKEASILMNKLEKASGYKLSFSDNSSNNCIRFKTNEKLGEEGYEIEVDDRQISLSAATEKGMFYAIQTFFQLLPAEIESAKPLKMKLSVPAVKIADHPRFSYRGVMIDVSRHFFTVEELKNRYP